MASIGEIMAEAVTHAEEVTHEITVMYDHPSLSEIKRLTVEELYVRLDQELDAIDPIKWKESLPSHSTPEDLHHCSMKQLERKEVILSYLCELYRRNIVNFGLQWCEYDIVLCNINSSTKHEMGPEDIRSSPNCCEKHRAQHVPILSKKESMDLHERTITQQYWSGFETMKKYVKQTLRRHLKIKEIQLACLEQPMIYEEIEELMDSILDKNGNKISAFKEYLSPDHYRLIRAGVNVKEIKNPEELLASLRKMRTMNKIEKI